MTLALSGIGVSPGIAIGKAHVIQRNELEIPEFVLPSHLIDSEVERFRMAVTQAKEQLSAVRTRIPAKTPAEIAAFIDTHLLMLDDSTLTEAPLRLIRNERLNAEWAIKLQRDALVAVFDEMEDPYLRTRKDDVDHVVNRILRILLSLDGHPQDIGSHLSGHVIIADDLTPADTVLMQHQGITAFVTEYGGALSHTAILARGLGIPAIVGMRHARRYLNEEETIIVDGRQGVLLADTDDEALAYYQKRRTQECRARSQLARLKDRPAITRDGRVVQLLANIELPEDIDVVKRVGAAGVGLYRTEFLYMNRSDMPGEEEHLETYLRVIRALDGHPVTIRTLDLGADKEVDGGHSTGGRLCNNPALGLRAIRLCLKDPALFRPQLRAILRASAHGPVRMMIPMLSNAHELIQVLHLVEQAKRELRDQGLAFNEQMPVGGMIEVPAAALTASLFAETLDFLSIGTNDLIQYTLAIDRIDDEVNYLYDPINPAVLRLIYMVIKAGRRSAVPVSMCGEMAGDPRYTRLLLGLGLTEFSMQPSSLLEVKNVVNGSNAAALTRLARRLVAAIDPHQVAALLETINHSQ